MLEKEKKTDLTAVSNYLNQNANNDPLNVWLNYVKIIAVNRV